MLSFYGSTSKIKLKWARTPLSAKHELTPVDTNEIVRKYFPKTFMRYQDFIHRNLVMSERVGAGESSVHPGNFYLATLPQELQKDADRIR